jgi:hypothetical protein
MNACLLPLRLAAALTVFFCTACGADVDAYTPSPSGVRNEGVDPNAPPMDTSFAIGSFVTRTDDMACSDDSGSPRFGIVVDNQYRQRSVLVRHVTAECVETDDERVAPGEVVTVTVYAQEVIRIVDADDGSVLSSWLVTGASSLDPDRIVLRSTGVDI